MLVLLLLLLVVVVVSVVVGNDGVHGDDVDGVGVCIYDGVCDDVLC